MNATIISIGTELTTGQCSDTNAPWLSQRLTDLGVQVLNRVTVSDNVNLISEAIQMAITEADLVIATGGLGPTPDDLTREALSIALKKPLEIDDSAIKQLKAFFIKLERQMPASNLTQAKRPIGCEMIPNPRGTAPGIRYSSKSRNFFLLPGVPTEMRAMYEQSIEPLVTEQSSGARTARSQLLAFGISEARIGDTLGELMEPGRNPSVGTSAVDAVISIRIVARGNNIAEAHKFLKNDVIEVKSRLGKEIFGENNDTLACAVGHLLLDRSLTIATAESCTGGLIAKRLTDIPGSSGYYREGFITYHNSAKIARIGVPDEVLRQEGAVNETVAKIMAENCREVSGCDFSISTTGIAGPSGGHPPEKPIGLVYVGLAGKEKTEVRRLLLGDYHTREEIRDRTCKAALNMLRLWLIK